MASVDELTRIIKNKYADKNLLVKKIESVKLDIEALEIMREVQIKKLRGK